MMEGDEGQGGAGDAGQVLVVGERRGDWVKEGWAGRGRSKFVEVVCGKSGNRSGNTGWDGSTPYAPCTVVHALSRERLPVVDEENGEDGEKGGREWELHRLLVDGLRESLE
jgi:hypothetical protein